MSHQDFFAVLQQCGGYYECPRDGQGHRLGPLVGYAQRDEKGRQHVGDIYADCSALEQFPRELRRFAIELRRQVVVHAAQNNAALPDAVVALPFGGFSIGLMLAEALSPCRYLFPEVDFTPSPVAGQKAKKELIFGRHEPESGMKVLLAEDVCNAFSTTAATIELVKAHGAEVVGIACLLNRSSRFPETFPGGDGRELPVFAVAQRALPSYEQDDPRVQADVLADNVIWKPKQARARLHEVMRAHPRLR